MSAVAGAMIAEQRAHREHSARLMNAAIEIADACVRSEIESYCQGSQGADGFTWWNTDRALDSDGEDFEYYVDRALLYIELRSPDAFPWRFIRHHARPELVRFEDKP